MTTLSLSLISYVSFVLVLWFKSDIVETFSKITRTKKLLKIQEYKDYTHKTGEVVSYPVFLFEKYPGWITQLLSCPICLCFWMTLISTLIVYSFPLFLLPFSINYICSLTIYLLINKLI